MRPFLVVFEQSNHRGTEGLTIEWGNLHTSIAHYFRRGASLGADDRSAARHSLQHGKAESFR